MPHLAVTPENIILSLVVLSIFTGCLWLQHQLEKRGQ